MTYIAYSIEVAAMNAINTKLSSILQYSMEDNLGEWVECMGVGSGRG